MFQRTNPPIEDAPSKITYNIGEEPIILSKALLDQLLKEEQCHYLIALYSFYYYTAKWQQTNQPRATNVYCMEALHIGPDKFYHAQKRLIELGLIEHVQQRDSSNRIQGWYMRINFIWKQNTVEALSQNNSNQSLVNIHQNNSNPEPGNQCINALSSNNINALSSNKEENPPSPPSQFIKEHPDEKMIKRLNIVQPEYSEAFLRWLKYKRERGQSYKDEDSTTQAYKKLLKLSNNNPTYATEIVEHSMANTYAGLYEPSDKKPNSTGSRNYHRTPEQYVEYDEIIKTSE